MSGKQKRSNATIAFRPGGSRKRLTFDDPATLRVLYDPLKFAVVGLLNQPMAVKEIAERLGEPISRLYYHVRILERHGLIRAAAERSVGSNIERLYERTAEEFSFSGPHAAPPSSAHLSEQLRTSLQRVSDGIQWVHEGDVGGRFSMAMDYVEAKVPVEKVEEFITKLSQLTQMLSDTGGEEEVTYGFVYALTPVRPREGVK